MANFDLTNLAVKMLCPNNEVKIDDTDLPSIMVYIPKFKLSEVLNTTNDSTHPAFIVDGKEIDGFWFSKYQNVSYNNVAYSLPGEDPSVSLGHDAAYNRSAAKGVGWHLTTAAEWAAVALWCKKNGTMPYGNNNYGKDSRENSYKAVPTTKDSSTGQTNRVATGTGPLTWSHDRTIAGIWDMNGNVNEWLAGLRLVYGEVQILQDNDAANTDNPVAAASTCWKAINASTGELITPDGSGTTSGSLKLDYINNKWTYTTAITSSDDSSRSCTFENVGCADGVGDAAKLLLRALAMLPDDGFVAGDYESDYFWANNAAAERCLNRGGIWNLGTNAGVFSTNLGNARSYSNTNLGFRSAFIG